MIQPWKKKSASHYETTLLELQQAGFLLPDSGNHLMVKGPHGGLRRFAHFKAVVDKQGATSHWIYETNLKPWLVRNWFLPLKQVYKIVNS